MNPNNKKTPKYILWIFAVFFLTFITVDICYIIIAEKTWRGLATEDGYQKGLNYNQVIDSVQQQKKLGWQLQIKYHVLSSKNGNLEIILTDKNGNKIRNAQVNASITRPTQEGFDFFLPLLFNQTTSTYQSAITFPLIGQWEIVINAKKNDDIYTDGKRLVIR